jgi:outer membrane protein assembly factor BamB
MARQDPPRRGPLLKSVLPKSVVHPVWHLASFVLTLALLAACSLPLGAPPSAKSARSATPAPTATSTLPLASETVYWSRGDILIALRASDGRLRWKVGGWTVTLPSGNGFVGGPGTPTLADGTLYAAVSLDHAQAYALAATDGSTRWHTTFPGCLNLVGSAGPPLLAGGVLYVAVSGHDCAPSGWVYALRASDGTVVWRTPFEKDVLPTRALTSGALLVASSTYPALNEQDYLTALRPSDGARLWRVQLSISPYYLAAADGIVVVSGYFSGDKLEARRARDGQRLWITPANRYNNAPPVIANGLVYVSGQDGYLYALRLHDDSVQWRFAAGTGADSSGASEPAVVDSTIYWGAGPLLYALDARTGALQHAYHLFPGAEGSTPGEVFFVYSPPAVADGALFVAAQGIVVCGMLHCPEQPVTLYALDVATGTELWHHTEPEGNATLPPVVGP